MRHLRLPAYLLIVLMLGSSVIPAEAQAHSKVPRPNSPVHATSYESNEYGYAVSWGPEWQAMNIRVTADMDFFALANYELYVLVFYMGLQSFADDASACLDELWMSHTNGYPSFDLSVLNDAAGHPLEKRTETEAWMIFNVARRGPTEADRTSRSIGISLCRTLEPGGPVIAIESMMVSKDWETAFPAIIDQMNNVEYPATAPTYEPFSPEKPVIAPAAATPAA